MSVLNRTRFVPNPLFKQQLLHSALLVDDLRHAAESIAEHAKALAPVESGDYRDSIEADAGIGPLGVQGIVNANDPISGYIEFGTSDTPTFAPLRKGAQAAGFRLRG